MTYTTLAKAKKDWIGDAFIICHKNMDETHLYIVERNEEFTNKYQMLRIFMVGDKWHVSVDYESDEIFGLINYIMGVRF